MNTVEVAQSLKKLRKKQKLTQNDVAEKIGITPQAVSKWERGESLPDAGLWLIISQIYETTIDHILAPNNLTSLLKNLHIVSQSVFDNIILNPDEALDMFVYLSEDQKHEILEKIMQEREFEYYLSQVVPLTSPSHRKFIVQNIVDKGAFTVLENLAPYLVPYISEENLEFLAQKSSETLESLEPFLRRKYARRKIENTGDA
ncbi:MAG: helix-turn-helix transcriptional regulator [Defluviitaleaceae bacterium]|nr:helix-turn-helix transcriptional regulator [Defluviitaleaceae bacterium]